VRHLEPVRELGGQGGHHVVRDDGAAKLSIVEADLTQALGVRLREREQGRVDVRELPADREPDVYSEVEQVCPR
jgi:hypothetical protein